MSKAKNPGAKQSAQKSSINDRGARKPPDLEAIREEISRLVGGRALNLVDSTIAEADKGHYAAMKYLFEIIGLYPSEIPDTAPSEDVLAKTLLRRLGLPDEPATDSAVTKQPAGANDGADDDAVE